jgi:hypothetical protein
MGCGSETRPLIRNLLLRFLTLLLSPDCLRSLKFRLETLEPRRAVGYSESFREQAGVMKS